jgi:hypothetical protein
MYALPTITDYVSCSRQCHIDRPTPSSEPGTDYGVAYGSPLFAVESGRVTYTRTGNHGPTGRYIEYVLDDGRTTRSLHLAEVWVKPGDRVARGQQIGKTGASGNGSDWGYGAHVHQTLWPGAAWAAPTLDFEKYVGGGPIAGNQRIVGPNGVKGRADATTASAEVDFLKAGVVGTFDGWKNGENVDGNPVWFRGISGNWFWSGGFTDAGTHDLTDLNPPPPPVIQPYQRKAGPNGANARLQPSAAGEALPSSIGPGVVGDFNGWINGEVVEGNGVWFRGSISGNYFWSGGFEDKGTHDLADLNPPKPPQKITRTVGENPSNVRGKPYTSVASVAVEAAGAVIEMKAFAHSQDVEGQDVWFQRAVDGLWQWAGGFTDQSTTGLPEVEAPPDGTDPDDDEYTPDIVTPTAEDFPAWITYDERLDPDALKPDLNKAAYEYYGVKYDPIESHTHWWNLPGQGGTHDGNVNYILGKAGLSVNYVLSAGRVTLMVPLHLIAATTGQRNPFAWKSENDPLITVPGSDLGYKTSGYLHYIVEKLNPRLREEAIRLHKEFYETSCSDINTAKVREFAEMFHSGALDPATGQPPVGPEPETVTISHADAEEVLAAAEYTATVMRGALGAK